MKPDQPALLCALSESHRLATEIASRARVDLLALEERPFEEGEFKIRPLDSVRGRTIYVVQSLAGSAEAPVAQRLVRLLFLLFGLRDAAAARVVALIPYLSYARKDRRTQLRDPVSTRYVAQLLEATGVSSLVCLDVHNPAALDNAFRIPVDHLSALPMFVRHIADRLPADNLAVASPDVGGVKRAQIFRELLAKQIGREVDLVFVEKRRAEGVVSGGTVVGAIAGRTVIVLDDLCASGKTLIRAASSLREAGAAAVHVAFTHAPLARGVEAVCQCADIASVVTTDSAAPTVAPNSRLTELHVAPLFAEAVSRMIAGAPLAPLMHRWPPIGS